MRSYNLFRSSENAGLCCAVPEDRSVPPFVMKPLWVFEGKVDNPRALPLGFDRKAAATGVRFNGFYLYSNFLDGEPRARYTELSAG
ncbi:MAG: hypothetical protein ABW026_15095 [Microvirga sp.]